MFSQAWTQHLETQGEKDAFYNEVLGSKRVLRRLKEIIESKEFSLGAQEMTLKSYDSPNWGYRQAHINGFRQCAAGYKKLIDLDQQDDPNEPTKPI